MVCTLSGLGKLCEGVGFVLGITMPKGLTAEVVEGQGRGGPDATAQNSIRPETEQWYEFVRVGPLCLFCAAHVLFCTLRCTTCSKTQNPSLLASSL